MAVGFALLLRWSHKTAGSSARLASHMPPPGYKTLLRCQLTDLDQSAEFNNFVSYCDRSMCLFDISASYGAFSFAAAHFGGTAVAVDPSPIAAHLIGLRI